MSPVVPPPPDVPYTGLLRREAPTPFAGVLVASLGLAGFVLVPTLVTYAVYLLGWLARGRPGTLADYLGSAARFEVVEGMLGAHLGLATLIVITLAALRYGMGLAPRWVHSVQPGLRWRYLLLCLAVALVVIGATLWLTQLHTAGAAHPQPGYGWFLVVILLTTPLQAAAEEYFFRGFLLTLTGAVSRHAWVGILVSALLFALVHGAQSAPLFFDRFAFGVLAGVLVVATGGLEAAIAAHVANNLLAFTTAGLWGTIAGARTVRTLTWAQAAVDVTTFAVVAALCWGLGTALNVATRTPRRAVDLA